MPQYLSHTSTHGRNMAGERALWRAIASFDSSRRLPCLSKVAPATQLYNMEDVHRASLINRDVPRLSVNKLNTSDRLMIRFLNSQTGFGGNS
jgi:dihydroxyacid dehydratase/phosphogluconate dehydratase